jgi:hypothetical protein
MHLIEARDLTLSKAQPDADERIELGLFTIKDLIGMARSHEIQDAKTLVGILWLVAGKRPSV